MSAWREAAVDERGFERPPRASARANGDLPPLPLAEFKALVREQFFMLLIDQEAALAAHSTMLPAERRRRRARRFRLVGSVLGRGELSAEVGKRWRDRAGCSASMTRTARSAILAGSCEAPASQRTCRRGRQLTESMQRDRRPRRRSAPAAGSLEVRAADRARRRRCRRLATIVVASLRRDLAARRASRRRRGRDHRADPGRTGSRRSGRWPQSTISISAGIEIVDAPHSEAAAAKAVELIHEAKGELLMKGSLHTDELMRERDRRQDAACAPSGGSATSS